LNLLSLIDPECFLASVWFKASLEEDARKTKDKTEALSVVGGTRRRQMSLDNLKKKSHYCKAMDVFSTLDYKGRKSYFCEALSS
jgi:hypothetical protein